MTVFVITSLFIWAMIATAMAVTFWRAWRENISDLGHALDRLNWFPDDLNSLANAGDEKMPAGTDWTDWEDPAGGTRDDAPGFSPHVDPGAES